jgi:hypothetical protein
MLIPQVLLSQILCFNKRSNAEPAIYIRYSDPIHIGVFGPGHDAVKGKYHLKPRIFILPPLVEIGNSFFRPARKLALNSIQDPANNGRA